MPVTAKFSEEFYNRLGHQVAGEIVDWFNKVDAAYRSDFLDLLDARLAQFEAKQRVAVRVGGQSVGEIELARIFDWPG